MVADNANISGTKLDISSVITSINNNTTSINSSSIKFDDTGQSLLVAFNSLKNQVDTIQEVTIGGDLSSVIEKVNTHTTQIGVIQGQISSLIENTTITKEDGTTVQLKDAYNSMSSTVDSNTSKIGSLETNYNKVTGDIASVTSKQSTLEQDLGRFKTTVSDTYYTKTEVDTKDEEIEANTTNAIASSEANINNNIDSAIEKATTDTLANVEENYAPKKDYEEFKKSTASSIEQTTKDVTIKFDNVTESVKSVGGELKEFKETVSSNIQFSEDGINISRTDSPFAVNISNEKMSFTDTGQEVAYISNREMRITDAVVENSLTLGNFKFIPRVTGNVSLIWDNLGNIINYDTSFANKTNSNYPTHTAIFRELPVAGQIYTIEFSGILASTAHYWGIYNAGGEVHVVTLHPWEARNGVIKKSFVWRDRTEDGSHTADSTLIHMYPMYRSDESQNSTVSAVKMYRGDDYWSGGTNLLKYNNLGFNGNKYNYVAQTDHDYFRTDIYAYLEKDVTYSFSCDVDCNTWEWNEDSSIDAVYGIMETRDQWNNQTSYVNLTGNPCTFTVPTTDRYWLRVCVCKNGASHYFSNLTIKKA